MTRPFAVFLFAVSIAITACGTVMLPSRQTAEANRSQNAAILASPTTAAAQGQNEAVLMGGNSVLATPEPTAQPTADPLLAQMAADVKAANERADAALKLINDQAERIAEDYKSAASDNAKTAKYNDAQRAKDVDIARENRLLKEADAANNAALAELVKAQADLEDARSRLILSLCLVVVTLIGYLLMKYAMSRPHVNNIVTRRANGELAAPIARTNSQHDYDTTPPGDLAQFAELMDHGIKGGAMGNGSVIDAELYTSDEYKPVREWLYKKDKLRADGREPSLFKNGPNNSRILSVDGIVWAQAWLDWYDAQPPAPDA